MTALVRHRVAKLFMCGVLSLQACLAYGSETLVIAAAPSVKLPLEALSRAFEESHPEVRVQIFYDSGLGLRQRISSMQNSGRHFIESGPIHLVAPASDELLTRLENKYYVLPGTKRPYATTRLVLVVPESLVEAPGSLEDLAKYPTWRLAVADPTQTEVGRMTEGMLSALGLAGDLKGRLDTAVDAAAVLDHVLSGRADAGIVLSSTAANESQRIRIAAVAPDRGYDPPVHSIAMDRYCPSRALCEEFLKFVQTERAKAALRQMGYGPPNAQGG